jgi:tetratricopeptide (TPR) repeat protein
MKKPGIILIIVVVVMAVILLIVKGPIARSINVKGIEQFKKNELAAAERYFIKAIHWKKSYQEARINLVKAQLSLGKIEDAQKNLSLLIKRYPNLAETLGLQGELLVMQQNYPDAIQKLSEALSTDSLLVYAYFYRAIALANIDSLEAAARDYLRVQDLDKMNKEVLEKGAIIFSKLENFEAAIKNYDRLIDLDPTNTMAFLKRGNFKMRINDFKNAIPDFTKALMLNPDLPEAYYNRGRSFGYLQEYEKAVADFDKSAAYKYKEAGSYFNSGLANFRLQQYEKAALYLEKSIRLDTEKENTAKAYYILGVIDMMQNKSPQAIKNFDHSIAIDSVSTDAYYNRAIAYGIMKEYTKAISDLDKCLSMGRKTADVYYARGVQLIGLNRFGDGCSDLSKAEKAGSQEAIAMRKQYCQDYP